jgi:hypothetical protein
MNLRLLFALWAMPVFAALADTPWHHPLYLANGGYWPRRVPVQITNSSPETVSGEPVAVAIPTLEGSKVESLRVCRADGVELLFDIRDGRGRARRTGTLKAEDRIMVPAECAAKGTATVFVYAGNDQAWAVPDFLPGGFMNGDFESGDQEPDGWQPALTDAEHVLTWEKSGGRNGTRGAKAEVPQGAAATWVHWQQSRIPVVPGRVYRLSGWVRGENVAGSAGWYVHVNTDQPQMVNQTLDAGQGSFDWRQVSAEFRAPTNAKNATIGTVLHGIGRAWFDDVEFVELNKQPRLRATAGAMEFLSLNDVSTMMGNWDYASYPYQVDVRVLNLGTQAAESALVAVEAGAIFGHLPVVARNPRAQALSTEKWTDVGFLPQQGLLIFPCPMPARSRFTSRLFFSGTSNDTPASTRHFLQNLHRERATLVQNGSFEEGEQAPRFWIEPATAGNIVARFSKDAWDGDRSVELVVPPDAKPDWVGWRTPEIPVKPGANYLYSGFLKAKGLRGPATLHAHFHNKSGALTRSGAMVGTQPPVSGDADWTNSSALVTAPPDAASIQLHLTMNTQGTLCHDAILFAEVLRGEPERYFTLDESLFPDGCRVWQVNPLVKVFPDTPAGAPVKAVEVECARNEYEPFQLALRSRGVLRSVTVTVSDLRGPAGAVLPPVKVERVGFVPVDHPTAYYTTDVPDWCRKVPTGAVATDGWAGEWPDPLMPARPFDVETPNRTQPIWFTVHVPAGAAAGTYRGEITIRASVGQIAALPLTVNVLPFALPDRTRLKAIFDFRRGPGGWHGPDADSPAERRKWLRLMAEHRLGVDGIQPAPRFAYKDGQVTMEASEFDATAKLCFDELGMNACYTPWFFYMFGWAYPPKKFFGLEPFTPEWTAAFKQAYRLFTDHLRAKGWHDKFVYYVSDEPHFDREFVVEQMKKVCALIHEVDPKIPIYSSTWRHCPAWGESLDLWGVGQHGSFPVSEMERLQKAGKRMWFTCDGQMATDTPFLATERMLPYYCLKYGVEGFEFWGLSWWTYNPWERGWHTYIRQSDDGKKHYWIRYPNGDGFLAYPGKTIGVDGPVSCIRLEQVREGLEDYEAMALLADLASKARQAGKSVVSAERALAMARGLVNIPNAGGLRSTAILPDPDQIPRIRRAVNAAIVELVR